MGAQNLIVISIIWIMKDKLEQTSAILLILIMIILVYFVITFEPDVNLNGSSNGLLSQISTYYKVVSDFLSKDRVNNIECHRDTPYKVPQEFDRAGSLIAQRLGKAVENKYANCIDIQYKDLSLEKVEGYFQFDPSSTIDHLKIFVDYSYREFDDILTAVLLTHEFTHVGQYVDFLITGKTKDCILQEVDAFSNEANFIASLNKEEGTSLVSRILSSPNKNSAYLGINEILQINFEISTICGSDLDCFGKERTIRIEKMVKSIPGYHSQCGI